MLLFEISASALHWNGQALKYSTPSCVTSPELRITQNNGGESRILGLFCSLSCLLFLPRTYNGYGNFLSKEVHTGEEDGGFWFVAQPSEALEVSPLAVSNVGTCFTKEFHLPWVSNCYFFFLLLFLKDKISFKVD